MRRAEPPLSVMSMQSFHLHPASTISFTFPHLKHSHRAWSMFSHQLAYVAAMLDGHDMKGTA